MSRRRAEGTRAATRGQLLYSPFTRVVGTATALLGWLLVLGYVVGGSGVFEAALAVTYTGFSLYMSVVVWRLGIRLDGDVAIVRKDLRSTRLHREDVHDVSAVVVADLWLVTRWELRIEHTGGVLDFKGLVGYSLFGGRNRRVDRQVEILRAWAAGEGIPAPYRSRRGELVEGQPAGAGLPATSAAVCAAISDRIGGTSEMRAYHEEGGRRAVALVEARGTPHPGLDTYATASLHAAPSQVDGGDVRVELIAVGASGADAVGNVLATAALRVVGENWLAAPGVVFPDMVEQYFPAATVKHLLWVEPFDFPGLSPLAVVGLENPVHLLQGLPITGSEYEFLRQWGFHELDLRLRSAGVKHFDLTRQPVV